MTKQESADRAEIQQFFDTQAWQRDARGEFAYYGLFATSWSEWLVYWRRAILRQQKFLPRQGKYFLEGGCGAFPVREFSAGFERHVCVDFSLNALRGAREKLGEGGWYIVADIARLPFREGVFDAALSPFVMFHVVEEDQLLALQEFCRVLRPAQRGMIFYHHDRPLYERLEWLLQKLGVYSLVERLRRRNLRGPDPRRPVYVRYFSRSWFREKLRAPGHRVTFGTLVIFNPGMSEALPRNWLGRWVLGFAEFLESSFPRLTLFFATYLVVKIETRSS